MDENDFDDTVVDDSETPGTSDGTGKRKRSDASSPNAASPKNKEPKSSPTVDACSVLGNAVDQICEYYLSLNSIDGAEKIENLEILKLKLEHSIKLLDSLNNTACGICNDQIKDGRWHKRYKVVEPKDDFTFDPSKSVTDIFRDFSTAIIRLDRILLKKIARRQSASDSYLHIRQMTWASSASLKRIMASINGELGCSSSPSPSSNE